MNRTWEDYMDYVFGERNVTFNLSDFYDNYAYKLETFRGWERKVETLKILNKAFTVISIMLGVLDLLLLVTVFSASVRKRSAGWYLYHLNFVTILQVTFSLPRLEGDLHSVFGTCMFFSFTTWTLSTVYSVNLVIMNIEILATILSSNPRWKRYPEKRFVISMTATWISCILLSIIIMFFGHEEHTRIPICFHQNKMGTLLGIIVKDWIPALFVFAQTIAGLVLFIRTKRSPENYRHMMESQNSLRSFNEWFACFLTWNLLITLTDGMLSELYLMFFRQGIFLDIIFQMIVFLVRTGLPLICLMMGPVRETYTEWTMKGVQFVTGTKRSSQSNTTDTQSLHMETFE